MKVQLCVLLTTLVVALRAEPPSNSYGTPLGQPLNSYGTPNYDYNNNNNNGYNNNNNNNGNGHDNHEPGMAYEFGYQVKDDYSGNNYNRQETSDGNQVRGEYRVALPDGRTQIVTYYADWQTGFHADVRYEGTAQYPEQYNTNNQGGYANNGFNNNNYNNGHGTNNDYSNGGSATSAVSIKDFSGDSTPYNTNSNNNNGYNYNRPSNNNNFGPYKR